MNRIPRIKPFGPFFSVCADLSFTKRKFSQCNKIDRLDEGAFNRACLVQMNMNQIRF